MYKCPNCGGEIAFLPESGIIKCEYCGSEFSPETIREQDLQKTRKTAEEHTLDGGRVYVCTQCGANIYTTEETGVTFCSYCGSQAFLESRIKGEENVLPDLIIPFRISKEDCEKIYKDKIRSAWFLPRKMKADDTIDKFRGIYMPCWVYTGEADAEGDYTSVVTTREGAYDIIDSYSITATAHGVYGGFTEDASSSFPDGIMEEIAPFDIHSAKPFNDRYMTGFYADIGNVPPEVYNDNVFRALDANIKTDLSKSRDLRREHVSSYEINHKTTVNSKITQVRKGFLPVWFLSNKNEHSGRMSYAVINGLTGKIHADLPIDMKKYLLLSLLIAVPVFIFLQFFTMKPMMLLLITMILLSILMFFSTKMIREKYVQEQGLDDEGLLYLKQKKQPDPDEPDYHNTSYTSEEKHFKASRSVGGTLKKIGLGLFCFIGIPFLSAVFYVLTDINIIIWGFIAGVVLFILFVSGGKKTGTASSSDGIFTPGSKKIRLPFGMVLRSILLPLIGILAGVFVVLAAPASDLYYYGVVLLCCLMLILTMMDFVKSTNRLSLRKPAQLGKRGGDENG